jgi:hypothetical protein
MTIITGKHKELLVELLVYHFKNKLIKKTSNVAKIYINIKEQNEDGKWYINYYLNDYGN